MLTKHLLKKTVFTSSVTPVHFLVVTFVSITVLWYFVFLPLDLRHGLELVLPPIDDSNQSQCYVSYAWNSDNERHRFPYMTDSETAEILEKGDNIYFHVTNCIQDGILTLNARQACAVESAARINSHLNVFLTYTAPVGFLNQTSLPIIDAIMSYPNVHIRNIDLIKYAEETPAVEWIKEGKLYDSVYLMAHVSDFLRLVSLYRWGGIYLDLDTVMLKNISLLGENFAGAESDLLVANAVLNMNKRTEIGHKVAKMCLTRFTENYFPGQWAANGPYLVTNVLQEICGMKMQDMSKMTREQCDGFNVYDSSYFYALPYWLFTDAFDKDPWKCEMVMKLFENATLAHMSNKLSADHTIEVDSPVGYGVLAELHCPIVYHSLSETF